MLSSPLWWLPVSNHLRIYLYLLFSGFNVMVITEKMQTDCRMRKRPVSWCPSHKTGCELNYRNKEPVPHALSPSLCQSQNDKRSYWDCSWQECWVYFMVDRSLVRSYHFTVALGGVHSTFCSICLRPITNLWLHLPSQQNHVGPHMPSSMSHWLYCLA